MTGGQPALLEVALVVVFGQIECRGRGNLGHDRLPETAALPELRFRLFGDALLLGCVIEDRGAILSPHVGPLPVERGGIVVLPEHVEQLVVAHFGWIVSDLHDLSMSRSSGAHVLVSRIGECAAKVADHRILHSSGVSECHFHAPETSRSKCSHLCHKPSRFLNYVMCATWWRPCQAYSASSWRNVSTPSRSG